MTKDVTVEAVGHHGKDYVDPPPAPFFDIGDLGLWSFYRALIADFIATLLFLYVTVATVISHKKLNAADQCDGVGILGIAWAFGGMIFILVYCTAGISGGNINPLGRGAVPFGESEAYYGIQCRVDPRLEESGGIPRERSPAVQGMPEGFLEGTHGGHGGGGVCQGGPWRGQRR